MAKPADLVRVQFIHGLEGSPRGAKAQLFAAHFDACTPAMNTGDFEGCVERHRQTLAPFGPDVLVGSSFGGAIAVALLQRGHWTGPTLLLAPAALRVGLAPWLPDQVHIWVLHGVHDSVIDIADSRRLVRSGTPGLVRLMEVDDDHALHRMVGTGELVAVVRALLETARERQGPPPRG